MKRWILLLALLLSACAQRAPAASCTLEDGRPLDVSGRADGIYGVRDDVVDQAPLATIADVSKTGEGVDAESGKRWVGMQLSSEKTAEFMKFTSAPTGRRVALVANGQVASVHKVRTKIDSGRLQISCCNPAACDTWNRLLTAP